MSFEKNENLKFAETWYRVITNSTTRVSSIWKAANGTPFPKFESSVILYLFSPLKGVVITEEYEPGNKSIKRPYKLINSNGHLKT